MSSPYRRALLPLLLLASSFLVTAQDRQPGDTAWIRVTQGTLSVYTQGDPKPALAVIQTFAQLRNALAQASGFPVNQTATLKIVAFHSERDFNEYRLNNGSCAFYQQTRHGEYVVLQDLEAKHREVFSHEFTHFVLAHSGLTLPLWLNEGMADFYSTFQIAGDEVTFGRAVAGRLAILRGQAWLPLAKLFDVSTSSSYYSDPGQMALFYSESWALTHMLIASPAYGERFPYVLRALREGRDIAGILPSIYNKTLPQIQDDLREYVDQQHLPLIEARLTSVYDPALPVSVVPISRPEMEVTLADLTVTDPNQQASIETRLTSAATQLPNSAAAEEALGYLALRNGNVAAARTHFRVAVDRHSADPNVMFYLAHLDHAAGAPSSQVIPLLEQALALDPDLGDALLELALVSTEEGHYDRAIAALQKLTRPRPENAYAAAYTEAYCYQRLEKLNEARAAGRRAQALAANDHDRAEISELLDSIRQQAAENQ